MATDLAGGTAADFDIETYLEEQQHKDLLRFITCGSVDDGKSTLIGRLLFDTKLLFEDQLAALDNVSRRYGTQGDAVDLALLVDGLQAEREQGITIDVAYRFFATPKRKFIVADTPGHEQYTRNMATGASTADLAVILVDARKGILTQTRRHSFIVHLLGIRQLILAVNKMDLVGFDEDRFTAIVAEYGRFADQLGARGVRAVPISALNGDNLFHASRQMDWYAGPTLLDLLETAETARDLATRPFRMPVQWVNRPTPDYRGYSGTIAAGTLKPGDQVVAQPAGRTSQVVRIDTADGPLDRGQPEQSVTVVLADDIDIARGDVLAAAEAEPAMMVADQFAAHLLWMHEDPLLPHRDYLLKIGPRTVTASVLRLTHTVNINTLDEQPTSALGLNEIARCQIATDRPIAFDPYQEVRDTGAFVLIDRFTDETVGAGMIDFALRRATNIHWQALDVDRAARSRQKGQRPCILWFTGLSGSGKSTVANAIEKLLMADGRHSYLLDGDNVRHGLNRDLGFTDQDRVENIRRVAEVARLMVDAGLITIVSFISPFRGEREMARHLVAEGEFIEIFVDTPLDVCEARDPKGLYAKARAGQLANFTGIDSAYEPPEAPEIHLDGAAAPPEVLAERVISYLRAQSIL